MSVYNWENSANAHRKKAKKTGTVVLHQNETVDTSFDRLRKEYPIERTKAPGDAEESAGRRAPLMTSDTIQTLRSKLGFDALLPCQAQCYRGVFAGRDVILHSRTGSGKTLAYALPLVERHLICEKNHTDAQSGPFLLIFVFSNDLAVQTKGVLSTIYPKLRVAVAGIDDLSIRPCDILIGTVRTLDRAIRGRRVANAETAAEEDEKRREVAVLKHHGKRQREGKTGSAMKKSKVELEDDADGSDNSDADDGDDGTIAIKGEVSAANVRAVVIDEVDTTLGPRFSNVGRRMKNLLKYVRKSNGSLTEGLLQDYRAHHYVLCGATIPNWVIKAGFLGVKKYYYRLVATGTEKLPEGLECFQMVCPSAEQVQKATDLLVDYGKFLGRTVVFGTPKRLERLNAALQSLAPTKGSKKASKIVVRTLTPGTDELDRIAAIEDFNSKVCNVLLCTDVAARGLDFVEVDTVLMLSLPHHTMAAETFVHRAGRTARVNRVGRCLVLHDASEEAVIDGIVKSTHVCMKKFFPEMFGSSSNPTAVIAYQLTVKNPFRYSRPEAKVPTAQEVLEKNMGAELLKEMRDVKQVGNDGETVTFLSPLSLAHEVKQKLWKYSLTELPA